MSVKHKPTPLARKTAQPMSAEDFQRATDWPTVREVAEMYGLSLRWTQEQVKAGRFRCIRLNLVRVDPEDFLRFLNERNNERDTDDE